MVKYIPISLLILIGIASQNLHFVNIANIANAAEGTDSPTLQDLVLSLPTETIPRQIKRLMNPELQKQINRSKRRLNVPADSEYLVFIVDTSGSMVNGSWSEVLRQINDVVKQYPQLVGMQVISDMGDYLFPDEGQKWLDVSPSNLERIRAAMADWSPISNSSPLEGITEAFSSLVIPGEKVSLYVMGDELQTEMSLNAFVTTVETFNASDKSARIHGLFFPMVLLKMEPRFHDSANNWVILMRELSQRNNGTFTAVAVSE